jgi:hypothetical protein
MVIALAVLAGVGVEQWRRPEGRGLYWTRLGTAGAFAVTLGAGVAWIAMGDVRPTFIRATALAGFWGLGSGILSLTSPEQESEKQRKLIWEGAVVLWIVFDLVAAGWGLNPSVDLDFYQKTPVTVDQVNDQLDDGRLYLVLKDEEEIKYERFLRFDTFDPFEVQENGSKDEWYSMRGALLPNLNLVDDIPVVNNYDPFTPGHYARWMEAVDRIDIGTREKLYDLMAIDVVEKSYPDDLYGVSFVAREIAKRARWVPCAHFVNDEETAWKSIIEGTIDFNERVIIEGISSQQVVGCEGQASVTELVEDGPNRLWVQLQADSEGWLVLSDVWYPGWQATVDGRKTEVERANYLFRAVKVPKGNHEVLFVYQPVWFYVGAAISLFTCLVLAVFAVVKSRRNWSQEKEGKYMQ